MMKIGVNILVSFVIIAFITCKKQSSISNNEGDFEEISTNTPLGAPDADFHERFDNINLDKDWGIQYKKNTDALTIVAQNEAAIGVGAAKFTLNPNVIISDKNTAQLTYGLNHSVGSETTCSFYLKIPTDFGDSPENNGLILTAWNAVPDPTKGQNWDNLAVNNPLLQLQYYAENGKSYLRIYYGLSTSEIYEGKVWQTKLGGIKEIAKGAWNKITIVVKWVNDESGYMKALFNDQQWIAQMSGRTMANTIPAYFKIGLVRKTAANVISVLFDDLNILCKKQSVPNPDPAPNIKSVAEWENNFTSNWNSEYITADAQSKSIDSWDFYNLAYGIDANTTMFQATGNTKYLDRALYYINNVMKSARISSSIPTSQFKDQYLAWISNQEGKGYEYSLYESYCWRYVTTLLRIIKNSPSLLANSTYNDRYKSILDFTEKNIFNKWYLRNANSYVYRENTHMTSHWMRISMDLWDITQKDVYWQVFNNINYDLPNYASSIRGQLKPNEVYPDAYSWKQNWVGATSPVQDVEHGNAVVGAIVEAHGYCQEYKNKDISALIKTFNVIWPSETKYAGYVDGSGAGSGWFNDGFVKLGRYDVSIQQKLENHRIGQNTQFFGNAALNAKILLDGKPVYPTNLCSATIYKIPN